MMSFLKIMSSCILDQSLKHVFKYYVVSKKLLSRAHKEWAARVKACNSVEWVGFTTRTEKATHTVHAV